MTQNTTGFSPSRLPLYFEDLQRQARFLTRDSVLADDLVQETFERALRAKSTFREGASERAWLSTILRNAFFSQCRRGKVEGRVIERVSYEGERQTFPTEVSPRSRNRLGRGFEGLSKVFQEVLWLVEVEEYTYSEAAAKLEVPVGTVMSRLYRAKRHLRADYEKSSCQQAA